MRLSLFLVAVGCAAVPATEGATVQVQVNCDQGQRIGAALARLDPHRPNTVNVRGTCTERVDVHNFESLTLRGAPAAVISEPSVGEAAAPLQIFNSRSLVVRDITVRGRNGSVVIVNCQECRVQGITLEGVAVLGSMNSVLFQKDVFHANAGFAAFAVFDNSTAQIVGCTLDPGSGSPWWGVLSAKGSVTNISGTSIRGFGIGIGVTAGALLSVEPITVPGDDDSDQTVVIADNWYRGIDATAGSTVQVAPIARLENNGDSGRAGIMVSDGSHLDITGGARIIGTRGNGLVVVNNSTATAHPAFPDLGARVEISGSLAQDVFCDATSVVSGTSQLTGVTKVTCPNQNPEETVPLP